MRNILSAILLLLALNINAQNPELGTVNWLRNYEEALNKAAIEEKPIFILFQEVPGCSTCVNYGQNVLSHPLIVDALEHEFIPLAIFNNKSGHDAKILGQYKEPSWNNPVSRIVDKNGKNIVARLSGNYAQLGLVNYMIEGLRKINKEIPQYLLLTQEELTAKSKRLGTEYYSMYCFWSGEAALGKLDGVIATTPGFMNGKEVVELKYDQSKINHDQINTHAKKNKCKHIDSKGSFRADKDPQYYLKNSTYAYIPLSPIQRSKINSYIAQNKNPNDLLSPTQLEVLEAKNTGKLEHGKLYDQDFKSAWISL